MKKYFSLAWIILLVPLISHCGEASASQRPPAKIDSAVGYGRLSQEELIAINNILNKRGNSHLSSHAIADVILDPQNPDPRIRDISQKHHNALIMDGENSLMMAALYAHTRDRRFAQASINILYAWAATNKSFYGKNGFLASAWGVGAMARAARILQMTGPAEWNPVYYTVTMWMIRVAETQWYPIDPANPPAGSSPEILNPWEMNNVSNRTIVALEATMHVALLAQKQGWYLNTIEKYKEILPKYVITRDGMNSDDYRGDIWHKTAGIASATQICEMAWNRGIDLYSYYGDAVLRSAEFYAPQVNTEYIPFWPTLAKHYGQQAPLTLQLYYKDKGPFYNWYVNGVEFIWGLGGFL